MRISDWSSDVCSSDLRVGAERPSRQAPDVHRAAQGAGRGHGPAEPRPEATTHRGRSPANPGSPPGGRGVDAGADRTVEHPVGKQGCTGRTSPGRILGRYRSATRLQGGPGQMNKSLLALSVAATMLLCGPASHAADRSEEHTSELQSL